MLKLEGHDAWKINETMKSNKSIFICFVGIDGSGKTTLATMLNEAIKEHGVRSKCVYGRFISVLLKFLVEFTKKLLSLRGKNMNDYAQRAATKEQLFKNRLLAHIYHYFVFLDYLFQIFIKIRLPLMLNQSIICDRYIYDTVADLAVDFSYTNERTQSLLRNYLRFAPKPDLVFFIDLPEEVAFQRGKEDIPSPAYLSKRRGIYLRMSQWDEMVVLDGTRNIKELSDIVKSRVISRFTTEEKQHETGINNRHR